MRITALSGPEPGVAKSFHRRSGFRPCYYTSRQNLLIDSVDRLAPGPVEVMPPHLSSLDDLVAKQLYMNNVNICIRAIALCSEGGG